MNKRRLTPAAVCAKAIRKDLKELFPDDKFSVTSHNFAGGDAVHVDIFPGGPAQPVVMGYVEKYQCGNFDGMTDMYNYDNVNESIPQVKYVQVQRILEF